MTWRADGPAPPDPRDVGTVDASEVLVEGPWRHRFVAANGARFHVAEAGSGPLVLFLHGFPQFWWAWRHQLPAVAEAGFHAVAMDLRGYGASDKPPRGYDTATLAADVAGVVRALGESRAVVVGHDWGGWLAWSMPSMTPRVTRAVAVVSMAHPLAMRQSAFRRRGRGFADVLSFQVPMRPERRLAGGDGVERVLREWAAPVDDAAPGHRCRALPGRRRPCAATAARCACRSWRTARWSTTAGRCARCRGGTAAGSPRPSRSRSTVPVLQLQGGLDPYVVPDAALASHRWAGPHLRYELVDGAGHFLPEEAPDAVTAALLGWLRDLPPDG